MILVKYNNYKVELECNSSLAGELLFELNDMNITVSEEDSNCKISIPINDVDILNKRLITLKKYIKLDKSFIDWKNLNRKKPVLIRVGVTYSIIYGSIDFDIPHKEIEDVCKYFFKPAVNQKSYKDGRWDGYIHLYTKRKRQFLTGLLGDVIEVFKKKNIPVKIEYTYNLKPDKEFDWVAKDLFKLSDDQEKCINACIEKRRCTIKAATGFGKTAAIARYVTAAHGVPTLFIANKKILLDDAANDFINGIEGIEKSEVSQIKDGWFGDINLRKDKELDVSEALNGKKIIVATIQSLNARLEDPRTRETLLDFLKNKCKLLMCDECQALGTKIWDSVIENINAPYRVFLSATPRRVDNATIKIFAYSGPIAFDTSASEQIEQGRLCDLDIQYWPYDHKLHNDNDTELNYIECYNNFIVNNTGRNKFVVERVLEMLDEERQVLVLIQFIEHGYTLKNMLLEKGLEVSEVEFVYGDTPDKKRQEIISEFRKGKFKVLIGSTVADAGLNIPSISGVVLCGAGNSDITHIQRIGRGSRTFDYLKNWGFEPKFLKDNNSIKVTKVIDILDTNVAFFKKQSKNRYYNACEEFGANRVSLIGTDRNIFKYRTKKKEDISNISEKKSLDDMFSAFKNTLSEKKPANATQEQTSFRDFLDIVSKYE